MVFLWVTHDPRALTQGIILTTSSTHLAAHEGLSPLDPLGPLDDPEGESDWDMPPIYVYVCM